MCDTGFTYLEVQIIFLTNSWLIIFYQIYIYLDIFRFAIIIYIYIMVSGAIARIGFYWGCPKTVFLRGSHERSHVVQTIFRMDLKISIGLRPILLGR